jgi:hypothetical protein
MQIFKHAPARQVESKRLVDADDGAAPPPRGGGGGGGVGGGGGGGGAGRMAKAATSPGYRKLSRNPRPPPMTLNRS